jgi:nicotinamidase-related amidase
MHDGANDYVAIYTPRTDIDPATACLVVVDVMYATGHPDTGLGRFLASQGRLHEAEYRYRRIAEQVIPNTKRLLEHCRRHDIRRVFLTYGSEVSDYSDLSPQMYALCTGTNNRVGEREHEIVDELKPLPNERVFNKITPSAFTSTPIELVLHTYGVDTLLFAGVSTNMCDRAHAPRRIRPGLRVLPRRGRLRRRLAGDARRLLRGRPAPLRSPHDHRRGNCADGCAPRRRAASRVSRGGRARESAG